MAHGNVCMPPRCSASPPEAAAARRCRVSCHQARKPSKHPQRRGEAAGGGACTPATSSAGHAGARAAACKQSSLLGGHCVVLVCAAVSCSTSAYKETLTLRKHDSVIA